MHIIDIRGITIHITQFKIHISYLRNHDSALMLSSIVFTCHPFQPSSISFLRVGNTFSISSPFDITKLRKIVLMPHWLAVFHSQCQWTRILLLLLLLLLLSLITPMAMGTQHLDLNSIESDSFQCSWKLWFRHYYQWIFFTGRPSFMCARSSHKRHHGYNYSYHRLQYLKILIRH